jgi:hypothetical protein
MGNQINLEKEWPSTPDIATLQQMHEPYLMVTKVLQDGTGKSRKAELIINGGQNIDADAILAIQDHLTNTRVYPNGGPGLYEFEVTDKGSTAKVTWKTRLGNPTDGQAGAAASTAPRVPMTASGQPLPGVSPATPPRAVAAVAAPGRVSNVPLSSDSEDLGNGLIYNSKFKILTYPDGQVFEWQPGKPLPHTLRQDTPPAATPLGVSMFGQAPAIVPPNPELAELRQQIVQANEAVKRAQEEATKERQARELALLEARHKEELAAIREASEKQLAELKEMVKAQAARPAENPELVELRHQLEEQKREAAAQRDLALRNDMDRKLEAVLASVREATANKESPVVTLLTGILRDQGSQSQESIRTIRELFGAQLAGLQTQTLTPEKIMALAEKLGGGGALAGLNEKVVGLIGNLIEMATRLQGGGDSSSWIDVVQNAVAQIGTAATNFSQAKAKADIAKAQAAAVAATAQARAAEAQAGKRAAPAIAPVAGAGTAPKTADEADRDALAKQMGLDKPVPPAPAAPPAAAPTGKRKKPAAAPAPAVVPPESMIKNATVEDLRETFGEVTDEEFFGAFLPKIEELREAFEQDQIEPEDAVEALYQARPFIVALVEQAQASKTSVPLAVDMLGHGKFEYLFERMIPEADEEFCHSAAELMRARRAEEKAQAAE